MTMTMTTTSSSSRLSAPVRAAFRSATPDDAARLAAFAEATFRASFGPHNTAADMDAYCAGAFGSAQQRAELADPARRTELVTIDDELAGYAQLRSGPPPAFITGEAPIELLRFYIDQRWHGRGLAQSLMHHTLEVARRSGARTVYLSVWDRNDRAIAFYARQGFTLAGSKDFLLGADHQIDHVMTRAIDQ